MANLLDSAISFFSPRWGAERLQYREYAKSIQSSAGKSDHLKGRISGDPHENCIPRDQIARLRWRSWNLYRNCPQARKICRTIGAKVIGTGLVPQSQATKRDGKPHTDFRRRAREVFGEFSKECDFRGRPGLGGQSFPCQSKTALRGTMLSGGVFVRFHHLTPAQQKKLGLLVPLQIQLIHVDRLDESKHGGKFFYGLELDDLGRVIAAWLQPGGVEKEKNPVKQNSVRVPASELLHLMAEEDVDQMLGTPWFGAALLTMTDRQEYQYNEMIAAKLSSCVVLGYRRSAGQRSGMGLQPSGGDRDLVDASGNPVTHMQPGMILDLGQTGEFDMANPTRPNSGGGEFISHLVRSEAVSVPGVKGSTLTNDYRQSSFSSERSADNDAWPEIEELQDWFSLSFAQRVYEECINAAVLAGLFDGVKEFSTADFIARRREYLKANWQGPVPRSINPRDDAEASRTRIKNINSSPQREAGQLGRDWRELLQEVDEFIEYAEELDLPEEIYMQALGVEPKDTMAAETAASEQSQDDAMSASRARAGFAALNSA
jgi:lambda family phage portal protein